MTVGEIVLEETADIKITITVTMTEGADVYFDNFVLQKKTTSSGDDAEFDGVLEDFEAGNFAAWTVTAEESVSREVNLTQVLQKIPRSILMCTTEQALKQILP